MLVAAAARAADSVSAETGAGIGDGADPYYLNDFNTVIDGVMRRYAVLLTKAELGHIATLQSLSLPARLLYARLVNRKGPCFRIGRLAYPEIGDMEPPIAELCGHGLLERATASGQGRLLDCFTLPELRAALAEEAAPRFGRRGDLLTWLGAWPGFEPWLARLCLQDPLVLVPEADPWPFLRFLFFGELRENLADFVTRALGHVVTERVDDAALNPHFKSRAEAEDAYRMARHYCQFRELRTALPAAALLAWWQGHGIARERLADGRAWFDRLVDRLGRRLEQAGEADAARALYATSPVAPARERRARLLMKAGRKPEAVALLREMAALPCHPEEAYTARQLLARVEKGVLCSEGRRFQQASPTLRLHYGKRTGTGDGLSVEAAVLAHYRAQGWQGVHSENWLWNASFGLLLWDVIYDPGQAAFHSPMQYAPADLHAPVFYTRRQAAIEARLALLGEPARALQVVEGHFAAKHGLANPFLGWHEALPEVLRVMLHRVPPRGHAAVLRHMARNLRHHAHGFADLFIWNEQDYRFIEIKGEGDQLAAHQFEWLRFFAEAGINVSLQKVTREKPPVEEMPEAGQ